MDRFTVREKHHSQEAIPRLGNLYPAANAPVSLHSLFDRRAYGTFDPLVADRSPVRAVPQRFKLASGLHLAKVSEPTIFVAA